MHLQKPMAVGPLVLTIGLLFPFAPIETRGAEWPAVVGRAREATHDVLIGGRHHGTAFVVTKEGLAITAAHVLAGGRGPLEFLSRTGERTPAKIVGRDLGHDLALLRINVGDEPCPFVEIAAEEPRIGDEVALLGTPLYRRQLLLFGRVASEGFGFEYLGNRAHYVECRYVSGVGPSGTSGGPWFDREGRVVGMQIGGMSLKSGWQGVSFLAPAAAIRKIVAAGKDLPTPTIRLVVEETWQQSEKRLEPLPPGTTGLFTKVPDKNGPAAKAGIEEHELVTKVDGRPVRFVADLIRHVRSKKIGEKVVLELFVPDDQPSRSVKVEVAGLVEGKPKPD